MAATITIDLVGDMALEARRTLGHGITLGTKTLGHAMTGVIADHVLD